MSSSLGSEWTTGHKASGAVDGVHAGHLRLALAPGQGKEEDYSSRSICHCEAGRSVTRQGLALNRFCPGSEPFRVGDPSDVASPNFFFLCQCVIFAIY